MNTSEALIGEIVDPISELDFQELEALDAPGFWTGFGIGVAIVGTAIASAGVYTAVSAIVTTWKIDRVYSPVLEAAVAMGRKPAAVTRVPVSIGKAVDFHMKAAARMRL